MEQPLAPAAAGHTKQYVFVDEYNRHKRLKVMRACDGWYVLSPRHSDTRPSH